MLFYLPVFVGVVASVIFPYLLLFLPLVFAPIPFFLATGSRVRDAVPLVLAVVSLCTLFRRKNTCNYLVDYILRY